MWPPVLGWWVVADAVRRRPADEALDGRQVPSGELMTKVSKPSKRPKSRITYANVMSTAAAVVAVASAATSKPVRKSIKRLRKRRRNDR
jgi:hypothetical protein